MGKRRKREFGGESNSSGFEIESCETIGSEIVADIIEAKSRDYNPDAFTRKITSKKTKIIRFIFLFFLCSAVLVGSQFLFTGKLIVAAEKGFFFIRVYFNFWLGLISLCIAMIINDYPGSYKVARQWHACEHKVIRLFEKKLELNLKNLKKMRRVHLRCGDSPVGEYLFEKVIVIFIFVAAYLVSLYFMRLDFSFGLALIGIVAVILIIIWGLIAYVFTTAKPTEKQLEETLRVAKEFKIKLEEQKCR